MSDNALAIELFEGLPARYDALAEVLSFAQNGRWRRERVRISAGTTRQHYRRGTGTAGGRSPWLQTMTLASPAWHQRRDARAWSSRSQANLDTAYARTGARRGPSLRVGVFDAVGFTYTPPLRGRPCRTVGEWRACQPAGTWPASTSTSPQRACSQLAGLHTPSAACSGVAARAARGVEVGRFLAQTSKAH